MLLKVYVPKDGCALASRVIDGSAIVSDGVERDGYVVAHFEGNFYGVSNLEEFHGRVLSAAGRLVERYPTVAFAYVPIDEMIHVADFDEDRKVFMEVSEVDLLSSWAGEPIESIVGVRLEPGNHVASSLSTFLSQLSFLGHDRQGMLYRSRAGQIIDGTGIGRITVYDHGDGEIRDRLAAILDPDRLRWAIGSDADIAAPSMR